MAMDPKKKKRIIIFLIVLVLLVCLMIYLVKRKKSSSPSVGPTTGNKLPGVTPGSTTRPGGIVRVDTVAEQQGWKIGDKVYVKPGGTQYGQFGIFSGPSSSTLVGILNEEWYSNNKPVGVVNAIDPFSEPELSGGFLRVTLPAGTIYYLNGGMNVGWGKKTTPANFDGQFPFKNAQKLSGPYGLYYVRVNEMKK